MKIILEQEKNPLLSEVIYVENKPELLGSNE